MNLSSDPFIQSRYFYERSLSSREAANSLFYNGLVDLAYKGALESLQHLTNSFLWSDKIKEFVSLNNREDYYTWEYRRAYLTLLLGEVLLILAECFFENQEFKNFSSLLSRAKQIFDISNQYESFIYVQDKDLHKFLKSFELRLFHLIVKKEKITKTNSNNSFDSQFKEINLNIQKIFSCESCWIDL